MEGFGTFTPTIFCRNHRCNSNLHHQQRDDPKNHQLATTADPETIIQPQMAVYLQIFVTFAQFLPWHTSKNPNPHQRSRNKAGNWRQGSCARRAGGTRRADKRGLGVKPFVARKGCQGGDKGLGQHHRYLT